MRRNRGKGMPHRGGIAAQRMIPALPSGAILLLLACYLLLSGGSAEATGYHAGWDHFKVYYTLDGASYVGGPEAFERHQEDLHDAESWHPADLTGFTGLEAEVHHNIVLDSDVITIRGTVYTSEYVVISHPEGTHTLVTGGVRIFCDFGEPSSFSLDGSGSHDFMVSFERDDFLYLFEGDLGWTEPVEMTRSCGFFHKLGGRTTEGILRPVFLPEDFHMSVFFAFTVYPPGWTEAPSPPGDEGTPLPETEEAGPDEGLPSGGILTEGGDGIFGDEAQAGGELESGAGFGIDAVSSGESAGIIDGDTGEWVSIDQVGELREGDSIQVGPDAWAIVTLHDGTVLTVDSDTMIRLEDASNGSTRFRLETGSVKLDLDEQLARAAAEVVMDLATVRVDGTVLQVWETGEESGVSVEEGSVWFDNHATGESKRLVAGESAVVEAGAGADVVTPGAFPPAWLLIGLALAAGAVLIRWSVRQQKRVSPASADAGNLLPPPPPPPPPPPVG